MAAKPPFNRLKAYKPMAIVNAPPGERKHLLRRFWFPAVLLLALAAGGLTGIIAAYQLNYSQAASEVAALATYRPSVVTRIYADDGKTVIGEFALEKRIPLKYEEIPANMKNAILAVEDARFYDHIGIDPVRIVGAAWKNLTTEKVEGGSTLTQQLAKNLFLTKEQTYRRKMNEWLLALQIERYYTKQQIMELYANHIFVGANAYGVEAGAETYFGKQAKDLTLDEAALLAAIPKAPGEYSPTANPAKAKERRDLVLDLMARNGFASEAEVAAAKAKPIQLSDSAYYQPPQATHPAFDYPVEYIRQDLEDKFTTRVAQTGLYVYSTINVAAQKKAYALVGAAAAIAAAVRPLLGGFITTYLSWRIGFLLEIVIIAIVLSGIGLVRDAPYTGPRGVDAVGAVLSVLGMGGIVLGILVWQEGGEYVLAILASGAIALAAFAFWLIARKRQDKPTLIDPDLFRSKHFQLGISQQMLQQISLGGLMIALPIYLQMVLEYNALLSGLSIAPLSLSMFGMAVLAGRRAGTRRPSSIIRFGFALLTAGMLLLIPIVPRADSGWWLLVPLVIAGSGLGLLVSQLNNYTLAPISEERVSEAAGVNSAGGSFGLSFGLAFAGAIMLATLSIAFTNLAGASTVLAPAEQQRVANALEDDAQVLSNTQLQELLAGQPEEVQDEIIRINTDARPLALQVALLVPILAGLVGLLNSFRMMRLPDLKPSGSVEGMALG